MTISPKQAGRNGGAALTAGLLSLLGTSLSMIALVRAAAWQCLARGEDASAALLRDALCRLDLLADLLARSYLRRGGEAAALRDVEARRSSLAGAEPPDEATLTAVLEGWDRLLADIGFLAAVADARRLDPRCYALLAGAVRRGEALVAQLRDREHPGKVKSGRVH